ncbi:hypothetical protein [uncultured Campylobacter sp.]|mgnify:FL=1|uniref:hypothetical protein n=1 Tax=uncultured Campylobacter sp. TaxID=218934 RepID=UPI002606DBC7|nr:hypothetical protein [uncultured Campylobacter sp.]
MNNFLISYYLTSRLGGELIIGILIIIAGFMFGINNIIAFIIGCFVFFLSKEILNELAKDSSSIMVSTFVPLIGAAALGYLAGALNYEEEQPKELKSEVQVQQAQQNLTQQDKIYYIQNSLMFKGAALDGKFGKKTMRAAQKYSGSSATSIDELYEAVRAKKEGRR